MLDRRWCFNTEPFTSSYHILHTDLHTSLAVLKRKIFFTSDSFPNDHFPYSHGLKPGYCRLKLDANP